MDTHGRFNKNCQWQDLIIQLIKKQFLNNCKDCKTFCKFEVILSRFILMELTLNSTAVSYG